MLRILEMLEPATTVAGTVHLQVEAYRALAWELGDLVSDPRYSPVAPEDLIADHRLRPRAEAISADRVADWPPGEPTPGGTAYLAFVDAEGLAVSLIQSNFYGLGTTIGAGDAGFILHNRGGGFSLTPGNANQLAPGKRPLHTLSPTLWTADGVLDTILGTRGGYQQPQLVTQLAWSLFVDGLDPAEAQAAPRWSAPDYRPEEKTTVRLEATFDPSVAEELRSRGHRVEVKAETQGGWGPVSVIQVLPDGLRRAASDPRVAVSAAAAT
jgi:gamma-glutamyltranspeptidase/glutathione hydrolase